MKCLFLTIGTKNYIKFVENLCISLDKFCDIGNFDLLCFSDQNLSYKTQKFTAYTHHINHEPHPYGTLHRYAYYLQKQNFIEKYDYVFHIDADMEFVQKIGNEIISQRVCTVHPGFYKNKVRDFTYENRQESHAYINKNNLSDDTKYYQNCLQGGTSSEFITMAKVINNWTIDDEKRNIIALWHDESYMNKYMLTHPPTLELDPSYAFPQHWDLPFSAKILHLHKDHNNIRYN